MRTSVRDVELVDAADEALEVAGLGQGEDLGVVRRGGAGFEELDAAAGIGCGCGDDLGEVGERDVVRAGAGDERAAGCEQADRAQVELLVAAEGAFGGAFGFGEGGRVEDDGVEGTGFERKDVAEVGLRVASSRARRRVEGVGFDPVDLQREGSGSVSRLRSAASSAERDWSMPVTWEQTRARWSAKPPW